MKPIETGKVSGTEGQWVLVVDDEVVASGDDPEALFRAAEKYPEEKTLVTKILSPGTSFY